MIVRLGMPETTGLLPCAAFDADAPVLVSASSLWQPDRGCFRPPGPGRWGCALDAVDAALDSAGFTVMKQWGGVYPWTVAQYAELAGLYSWAWWSAMDLCCEPQVAGDAEAVHQRLLGTATYLLQLLAQVDHWREAGAFWLTDPMPILQGWHVEDYLRSLLFTAQVLGTMGRPLPALVGVGSVCRRPMRGAAGVLALVDALHGALPAHVRLHLFGVKGQALVELADHPRIASVDSMAWDYAARREVYRAHGRSPRVEERAECLRRWYERNVQAAAPPRQARLPFALPG